MKSAKIKKQKKIRRVNRTRAKIKGTAERPRLSVFKSNQFIYAQLIDDEKGKTLTAISPKELSPARRDHSGRKEDIEKNNKSQLAFLLGKLIAEKAKAKGISRVIFDRGGYKYHGRIKALAEGARAGGLTF